MTRSQEEIMAEIKSVMSNHKQNSDRRFAAERELSEAEFHYNTTSKRLNELRGEIMDSMWVECGGNPNPVRSSP